MNPRQSSISLLLGAFGDASSGPPDGAGWGADIWRVAEHRPEPHRTGGSALPVWQGPRPPHDPLVGRQVDMRQVLAATQRNRLVVLTGPGGVGKSRLALAVAARLRAVFSSGVAVGELHDCPPEHLDQDGARSHVEYLVRELLDDQTSPGGVPGRRLLVLDGAEHVVRTVGEITRQLLDDHGDLHLIVTSRRSLAAGAAETWEIEPLAVNSPDDDPTMLPSAAELLLRRVRSSMPVLDLGSCPELVGDLCRLLDGIPLSIEIAAQRLRSIPITSLLDSDTLFQILGEIDAPDLSRHRTLLNGVRWSYRLLPTAQRELLHELAAFPGFFSLEDALTLRGDGDTGNTRIAHLLAELTEASMVRIERGTQYRYRLHSLVRHYVTRVDPPTAGSSPVPNSVSVGRPAPAARLP